MRHALPFFVFECVWQIQTTYPRPYLSAVVDEHDFAAERTYHHRGVWFAD